MKKLIVGIIAVSFVLLLAGNILAQTIYFEVEKTVDLGYDGQSTLDPVGKNDIFYISVYASNVTKMVGYQFDLMFDGTKVKYTGIADKVTSGDTTEENFISSNNGTMSPIVNFDTGNPEGSATSNMSVGQSHSIDFAGVDVAADGHEFLCRLSFEVKTTAAENLTIPFAASDVKFSYQKTSGIDDIVVTSITNATVKYDKTVDVDDDPIVPNEMRLGQNYPNPFNPTTTIPFALTKASDVKITVYNILGQRIATVVNRQLPAGEHRVKFSAAKLASGMYFYRMDAGEFTSMRKLVVIR